MITVNDKRAVAAAVAISFIAVSSFLILPLFVGAAASHLNLTEQQVGFLASGVLGGSAFSSILAIFWIRKVDWVWAGRASLGLFLLSHVSSLFTDSFAAFTVCQFFAGLGGGAAYSLALTVLSDNRHPDRSFGYSIAAQVCFQVAGLGLLPRLVETQGLHGVLGVLIFLALCGLVLPHWLPRSGVITTHVPKARAAFSPRVLAALAGCFFFFFNVGVVWAYIERIGVAAQFEADFIGTSLAIGVALGIPGALLASWCGERFGRIGPLALGTIGTVVALFLLTEGMSRSNYMLALALYNFVWNFSLTFQYAVVNAADDSGRAIAIAPAFHGAGGAVGPSVAATFVTANSFFAVNILAAAAVSLSLLMFVISLRYAKGTFGGTLRC